ncbi:MAG: type II toxin-antitoxin system VapC family toxin [Gaiellaceae bacterium]
MKIGLLDACIAIDVLRGLDRAGGALRGFDQLAASEVTRFEILAGVKAGEERATEDLFDVVQWLPVDEGVARTAGSLARRYRPSDSGIDDADYLVAATAIEYGARLLTTNVRHFPMLEGLRAAY